MTLTALVATAGATKRGRLFFLQIRDIKVDRGTAVASRPRRDPYLRNYLIRLLRQVKRSRKVRYQS